MSTHRLILEMTEHTNIQIFILKNGHYIQMDGMNFNNKKNKK